MSAGIGLVHLQTFIAIYRASSLTQAARELGVSQPAVTQRLQALEAVSGRTLFERHGRGVVPSAAATALAEEVAASVDRLEAVLDRMDRLEA